MRLDVERIGGFAGRTVRWSLDVDGLDDGARAEVDELLALAPSWPSASRPDGFSYRLLTAVQGAEQQEVRFAEPLTPQARRLLEVVRSASAPGPTA